MALNNDLQPVATETEPRDDPYIVGALVRGLEVLRAFNPERPTMSLTELANALGWSRTMPFRFVYTLQQLGYIHQDPQTKRYSLGTRVLDLGFQYLHSQPLPELAQPQLEMLREITNASAYLGVLEGLEVVYLARAQTRRIANSAISIGSRLPAHATSMGKVLLAYLPEAQLAELVERQRLAVYTDRTITDLERLQCELALIREQGYVFNDQEFEVGIRSVAAPIWGQGQRVIASLNVTSTVHHFDEKLVAEIALPELLRAARELSLAMGGIPGNSQQYR